MSLLETPSSECLHFSANGKSACVLFLFSLSPSLTELLNLFRSLCPGDEPLLPLLVLPLVVVPHDVHRGQVRQRGRLHQRPQRLLRGGQQGAAGGTDAVRGFHAV